MTPKEKAAELIEKSFQASRLAIQGSDSIFRQNAKNVAMVIVEECLKLAPVCDSFNPALSLYSKEEASFVYYWEQVKKEIELL